MVQISKYEILAWVIPVIFILLVPVIMGYYAGLVLDIIIMGVFALAYNLVFGHAGMVSLGHGIFFGLAGYTTGILITRWDANVVCFIIGITVATVMGFIIALAMFGRLRVGTTAMTRVLFVVIFTLGASYIFYYLFLSPLRAYTGGDNGLTDICKQPLQVVNGFSIDLQSPLTAYYLVALIGVMCIAAMRLIVSSPLATTIHGIKECELRVEFLGQNVFLAKVIIFTISAFFSAVAGILFIVRFGIIDLSIFQFTFMCQIIAICLIGGRKTFCGPLIGAIVYCSAKDILSSYTSLWLLIVGLLVVIVVMVIPKGIAKVLKLK